MENFLVSILCIKCARIPMPELQYQYRGCLRYSDVKSLPPARVHTIRGEVSLNSRYRHFWKLSRFWKKMSHGRHFSTIACHLRQDTTREFEAVRWHKLSHFWKKNCTIACHLRQDTTRKYYAVIRQIWKISPCFFKNAVGENSDFEMRVSRENVSRPIFWSVWHVLRARQKCVCTLF